MSDSYTPISMIRGNSTIIDSTPIVDGQILFDETRKCLFMDNGSTREKYSGLGADSNIANVEDTTTASQPYTTGEFVVVEGQLYKVTASIATGDTFSVGTNIETDTVGSEITKINASLSNIVPQALKNTQLIAVSMDVLDSSLDNNRLYFVAISQSTNCPPQATAGMGLRMMYYTGGNYWTNIVYFYHLDTDKLYFNAYHRATGAWAGWKLVGGINNMKPNFKSRLHTFSSTLTYTASTDCFIVGSVMSTEVNTGVDLSINSQPLAFGGNSTNGLIGPICWQLSSGDVVTVSKACPRLHIYGAISN